MGDMHFTETEHGRCFHSYKICAVVSFRQA